MYSSNIASPPPAKRASDGSTGSGSHANPMDAVNNKHINYSSQDAGQNTRKRYFTDLLQEILLFQRLPSRTVQRLSTGTEKTNQISILQAAADNANLTEAEATDRFDTSMRETDQQTKKNRPRVHDILRWTLQIPRKNFTSPLRPRIISESSHDAELISGEARSSPLHVSSTYPSAFAKDTRGEKGEACSSRNCRKITHGKLTIADDTCQFLVSQTDACPPPAVEKSIRDTLPLQHAGQDSRKTNSPVPLQETLPIQGPPLRTIEQRLSARTEQATYQQLATRDDRSCNETGEHREISTLQDKLMDTDVTGHFDALTRGTEYQTGTNLQGALAIPQRAVETLQTISILSIGLGCISKISHDDRSGAGEVRPYTLAEPSAGPSTVNNETGHQGKNSRSIRNSKNKTHGNLEIADDTCPVNVPLPVAGPETGKICPNIPVNSPHHSPARSPIKI
ncbi:hypothetical protein R1flu_022447 [Riccia fluitans]|uniref:Uncharacterized protein n=1 Tax=Riccia fluitans TaxID=41844 RepID=A0ABD1XPA4_9MARC